MGSHADRDGHHLSPEAPEDEHAVLEAHYDRLYALRFPEAERLAKVRLWRVLYDAFFTRYVPQDATVLDLGAGYCDFINQVSARRRIAIDVNPDVSRHAAPGVETYQITPEQLDEVVEPGTVDLVFASNVFEHMRGPGHLLAVLDSVRRTLAPSGRLVIMQPNVRLVGGRFWDFFDHTFPLTEKGMIEALTTTGFEIVECRARFLPYTTKSRMPQWALLVRLYLALRPAQWLLGKQMLVVAERGR